MSFRYAREARRSRMVERRARASADGGRIPARCRDFIGFRSSISAASRRDDLKKADAPDVVAWMAGGAAMTISRRLARTRGVEPACLYRFLIAAARTTSGDDASTARAVPTPAASATEKLGGAIELAGEGDGK